MKKCSTCGSYATNDDPDEMYCDPCYWAQQANEAMASVFKVKQLRNALTLARSMILCGEQMSKQAEEMFNNALKL